MFDLTTHQGICRQFATLFTYPDERVGEQAAACAAQLRDFNPEAGSALDRFCEFLGASEPARIEEAFTGTFDLQALCHPYVGYQLCGENQQRTFFMLRLRELYRHYGFTPGSDLPDHFSEVLRFVASIDDRECRQEILVDGLLPALEKCTRGMDDDQRPYLELIRALQGFLAETTMAEAGRPATERIKESLS